MNNKAIILIGISGSGKTTYRNRYLKGFSVVCPDDIRLELTGDISDQTQNQKVWKIANEQFWKEVRRGNDVVWDATNVDGKLLLDVKKRMEAEFPTTSLEVIVFYPNPVLSKKRIRNDIRNGKVRSNVPDEVIDRQYSKLLSSIPKIKSSKIPIRWIDPSKLSESSESEVDALLEMERHGSRNSTITREILESSDFSKSFSYSAVILNSDSRNRLSTFLKSLEKYSSWESLCHHMTINLGPITKRCKPDVGKIAYLSATHIGEVKDKVVAVKVKGYHSENSNPHVTMAVNRSNGGKPVMSNSITDWSQIVPIKLSGTVTSGIR